jgi:hypothetical protein
LLFSWKIIFSNVVCVWKDLLIDVLQNMNPLTNLQWGLCVAPLILSLIFFIDLKNIKYAFLEFNMTNTKTL